MTPQPHGKYSADDIITINPTARQGAYSADDIVGDDAPSDKPKSIADQLKGEGFLESAWNSGKGAAMMVPNAVMEAGRSVIHGLTSPPGSGQAEYDAKIKQMRDVAAKAKSGDKESRDRMIAGIPGGSTAIKVREGNYGGAAGDLAGPVALGLAAKGGAALLDSDAATAVKAGIREIKPGVRITPSGIKPSFGLGDVRGSARNAVDLKRAAAARAVNPEAMDPGVTVTRTPEPSPVVRKPMTAKPAEIPPVVVRPSAGSVPGDYRGVRMPSGRPVGPVRPSAPEAPTPMMQPGPVRIAAHEMPIAEPYPDLPSEQPPPVMAPPEVPTVRNRLAAPPADIPPVPERIPTSVRGTRPPVETPAPMEQPPPEYGIPSEKLPYADPLPMDAENEPPPVPNPNVVRVARPKAAPANKSGSVQGKPPVMDEFPERQVPADKATDTSQLDVQKAAELHARNLADKNNAIVDLAKTHGFDSVDVANMSPDEFKQFVSSAKNPRTGKLYTEPKEVLSSEAYGRSLETMRSRIIDRLKKEGK